MPQVFEKFWESLGFFSLSHTTCIQFFFLPLLIVKYKNKCAKVKESDNYVLCVVKRVILNVCKQETETRKNGQRIYRNLHRYVIPGCHMTGIYMKIKLYFFKFKSMINTAPIHKPRTLLYSLALNNIT